MNLTELASIIKSPQSINEEHISSIKEMVEKHPYSQIFTLLYLEALSKTKNVNFESELANYAFQVTDREQLFNLIHSSEITSESNHIIESTETDEKESTIEKRELVKEFSETQLESENTEKIEQDSTVDIPIEAEKIEEITEEVIPIETPLDLKTEEDSINSEVENTEVESSLAKEEIPDANIPRFDPLELDIIATAVSNTIEKEVVEEMNSPESIVNQLEEDKIEEENEMPSQSNSTRSFIDWLKENNSPQKIVEKDTHKQNIDSIVEKFIATAPKITKPKKEFFSPNKIAKKSLEESTMPVSETLAKILALQGNFPKAISAYEQLMLKYPEKKVFFADRIKELEQKLNK